MTDDWYLWFFLGCAIGTALAPFLRGFIRRWQEVGGLSFGRPSRDHSSEVEERARQWDEEHGEEQERHKATLLAAGCACGSHENVTVEPRGSLAKLTARCRPCRRNDYFGWLAYWDEVDPGTAAVIREHEAHYLS